MEYYDPMAQNRPWCRRPKSGHQWSASPVSPQYPGEPPVYGGNCGSMPWGQQSGNRSPYVWGEETEMSPNRYNSREYQGRSASPSQDHSQEYYEEEYENQRDMDRMKDLYPEIAKELMPSVEAACDQLEYEGSIMFDEYPDKTMLSRITARIYDQVKDRFNPPDGEDRDDALAMNVETFRRYPPRKNWLGDMIDVLFFEEMFRRRCRRRNCRRW